MRETSVIRTVTNQLKEKPFTQLQPDMTTKEYSLVSRTHLLRETKNEIFYVDSPPFYTNGY